MKKALTTEPTKMNPLWWPVVYLLVAGSVTIVTWLVCGRPNPFAKPATPQYEACVKCSHLFKPGTGKLVLSSYEPSDGSFVTNSYCSTDAPKYDRVEYDGSVVFYYTNGTTALRNGTPYYFSRGPEWVSVDANGERLDKPKPCQKEHVEKRAVDVGRWGGAYTNNTTTNWISWDGYFGGAQ